MTSSDQDSLQQELSALVDLYRARYGWRRLIDGFISPLSALVFFRWSAAHDSGIDEYFESTGQKNYSRKIWSAQPLSNALKTYRDNLRKIHASFLRQPTDPFCPFPHLYTPLEEFAGHDDELQTAILSWVLRLDLDSQPGCRTAGSALDWLVRRAAEADPKSCGEFFTPQHITELMVELVDPRPGDSVYDPCFGTGGVLVSAARRLIEAPSAKAPCSENPFLAGSIVGIEFNEGAYVVALARLVLTGIGAPRLTLGDALVNNGAAEGPGRSYDCVLAVPPWGLKRSRDDSSNGPFTKSTRSENLFLQHVMSCLKPGGRAVIALPDSILFSGGADREVRRILANEYRIEHVVSLSEGAFDPFTQIKGTLLSFRREQPTGFVEFAEIKWKKGMKPSDLLRCGRFLKRHVGARDESVVSPGAETNGKSQADPRRASEQPSDLPSVEGSAPPDTPIPNGLVALSTATISDLESRDYDLLTKSFKCTKLEDLIDFIGKYSDVVRVGRLEDVAEVRAGVSVPKAQISEKETSDANTGYLGVADLRGCDLSPFLERAKRWVSSVAADKIPESQRLEAGDILISKTGTIGKVSSLCPGMTPSPVGGLASSSLIVVRPLDKGDDHSTFFFWLNFLLSPSVQEWIESRSRGTAIRHLPVSALREMPVPVIPDELQQQVLKVHRYRDDVLEALIALLSGRGEQSVLGWILRNQWPDYVQWSVDDNEWRPNALDWFIDRIRTLNERIRRFETGVESEPLASWAQDLREAISSLDVLPTVPPSTARYVLLSTALRNIEKVIYKHWQFEGLRAELLWWDNYLDPDTSARRETAALVALLNNELEELLFEVNLEASVSQSESNGTRSAQIVVCNRSPLAVTDVELKSVPDLGSSRGGYLDAGGSSKLELTVPLNLATDRLDFKLLWRAKALDGEDVDGEIPLSIAVGQRAGELSSADLGTSPYIAGNPVPAAMLFGRDSVIADIQQQLNRPDTANIILLEGNRRAGKTSILRRLLDPELLPGWLVVDCSFQSGEQTGNQSGLPTGTVFYVMAREIARAAHKAGFGLLAPGFGEISSGVASFSELRDGLFGTLSKDRPFEVFRDYIELVLDSIQGRRLLLMLDEFEKIQEGIDSGVTSPLVPENLRYLLQSVDRLSAILARSRSIRRFREDYWSVLFGLGHRIPISALDEDDARNLVVRPVRGRLLYVPEARDRVIELCARQPYPIQYLCNLIFGDAARTQELTITLNTVDRVAALMAEDWEHLTFLWSRIDTERRRLLLFLCHEFESGPDPVTLGLLEYALEKRGVTVPRGERIANDLESLREQELVDLVGGEGHGSPSTYRLTIPLMGLWMDRNVDGHDLINRARYEGESRL